MTNNAQPFATGQVVGARYRIEKRIARGGMADVFAARDQVLDRPVALKAFRFDSPTGMERQRIQREIKMVAGLRHPGLVTVFDAGDVSDAAGGENPFFVMELVEGPTLGEFRGHRKLSTTDVAQFGAEIADALAYVHTREIVHRDIKPANILLDPKPDGRGYHAKLTDFGIALLVDSTRMTRAGIAVGTANYVSPEQATAEQIGPASDVYSLGLVLLECLTGEVAFPGMGVEAVAARLHRDPTIPANIPAGLGSLLAAMTARNPAERPTAESVAANLRALTVNPSTPPKTKVFGATGTKVFGASQASTRMVPQTPKPVRNRPKPEGRLIAIGLGLVAVLALLVLVVVQPWSGDEVPEPTYPTVDGVIGEHLAELGEAIP